MWCVDFQATADAGEKDEDIKVNMYRKLLKKFFPRKEEETRSVFGGFH